MFMLDTDMCIYILKNRSNQLRHKFKVHQLLSISSITYGELYFGIENGDINLKGQRLKQLDLFTQRLIIETWDTEAAKHYGYVRSLLKKQGSIIGNNDLLIAAHALSIKATLVTNNMREFSKVPDLLLDNWLE